MKTIYIYVLDTLADWELGNIIAELNSSRFFKKNAPFVKIKTVSYSEIPIRTMGGVKITPDYLVEDIELNEDTILLLPGATTWHESQHLDILKKANELLSVGGSVGAICGATVALANLGLLNDYKHTSNGPGFLEMFCSDYQGQELYIDEPAVSDKNLITASGTGSLEWAKKIIENINVFEEDTLRAWYKYFHTGNSKYYFDLVQSLPSKK